MEDFLAFALGILSPLSMGRSCNSSRPSTPDAEGLTCGEPHSLASYDMEVQVRGDLVIKICKISETICCWLLVFTLRLHVYKQ